MSIPKFGTVGVADGSCYVPDVTNHPHIDINGETTVLFEKSVADGSLLHAALTTAASTHYELGDSAVTVAEPFGRTINISTTDTDGVVILHGVDYLGQRMSEQITASGGSGTGAKAFKIVDAIESVSNVGNVSLDAGSGYGLPFCAVELVREIVDGVAATEGTLTVAVTATPTSTTGDVRGTYNPNTAGNAVKNIEVTYVTTNQLTGGLYGQRQA